MRVQSINLNLIPVGVMPVLHFSQFDRDVDGSVIYMIYNGAVPFDLTDCEAVLEGTKPDSTVFSYPCTVHNNFLTTPTYSQMTSVLGDYAAEIRISKDGNVVGTLNFTISVEAGGIGSADLSNTEIPALLDDIQNAVDEAEYWAEQAEGAVAGVTSFNGRHGSVLPMAGDYDSEKIFLASALHIGGETQNNVQEALEALIDDGGAGHTILNGLGQEMPQRKNLRFAGANVSDDAENDTTNVTITGGGSGGSTITVTTTETSLYGESVIISDGVSTFTGVFDNTGVCVIDGVTATGTLTVTSGAASRTLNVPYFGNYTIALSFWAATINVTTDPSINSAIVKKDGVQIGTVNFTSGSGTYIAGSTGAYTFEVTVGGVVFSSPTVTVTEQTTYSTVIDIFNATLSISTSSSELYGKTITIKKGSTVVGTTAFSAQGSASYTVHETGTYTCECEGYSGSATVSAETTYNVTINAGLDLSAWITAGSTTDYPLNPSSYADFAALEADEAAVRQLMTVHASVDYLAQATAGDSLMESVIGSDVCAKWINLSDYALDTLSANANIKSVMDTADKYGYGEWVKLSDSPETWGPKGNVPIMTANNAPYGVASAYQVFDGNASTSASGTDFSYQSVNPICVKKFECSVNGGTLQGSNDGSTYTDISTPASNTTYYMYHRVHFASSQTVHSLQFYGRELTPLVPTMTADNAPKGTVTASSEYQTFTKWKAFDENPSDGWFPQESDGYTNNYIQYTFSDSVKVAMVKFLWTSGSSVSYTASAEIYGSTDGSVFSTIGTVSSAANSGGNYISVTPTIYKAVKGRITANSSSILAGNGYNFQFYGFDYSEKEFAPGSTRKTIYDHGVAPNGINLIAGSTGGTPVDDGNQITVTSPNSAALSNYSLIQSNEAVNMGDYDYIHVRYGNQFVYDSSNRFHLGAWKTKMTGQNYANTDIDLNIDLMTAIPLTTLEDVLDITQISASEYPAYYASYTRAVVTASIKELWLE